MTLCTTLRVQKSKAQARQGTTKHNILLPYDLNTHNTGAKTTAVCHYFLAVQREPPCCPGGFPCPRYSSGGVSRGRPGRPSAPTKPAPVSKRGREGRVRSRVRGRDRENLARPRLLANQLSHNHRNDNNCRKANIETDQENNHAPRLTITKAHCCAE